MISSSENCYAYLACSIVPIVPIWVAITWKVFQNIRTAHRDCRESNSSKMGTRNSQGNDHRSCKSPHLFCSPANHKCLGEWDFKVRLQNPDQLQILGQRNKINRSSFQLITLGFLMQKLSQALKQTGCGQKHRPTQLPKNPPTDFEETVIKAISVEEIEVTLISKENLLWGTGKLLSITPRRLAAEEVWSLQTLLVLFGPKWFKSSPHLICYRLDYISLLKNYWWRVSSLTFHSNCRAQFSATNSALRVDIPCSLALQHVTFHSWLLALTTQPLI